MSSSNLSMIALTFFFTSDIDFSIQAHVGCLESPCSSFRWHRACSCCIASASTRRASSANHSRTKCVCSATNSYMILLSTHTAWFCYLSSAWVVFTWILADCWKQNYLSVLIFLFYWYFMDKYFQKELRIILLSTLQQFSL